MQVWFRSKGPSNTLCPVRKTSLAQSSCRVSVVAFSWYQARWFFFVLGAWDIDVPPPSVLVWQAHHQAVSPDVRTISTFYLQQSCSMGWLWWCYGLFRWTSSLAMSRSASFSAFFCEMHRPYPPWMSWATITLSCTRRCWWWKRWRFWVSLECWLCCSSTHSLTCSWRRYKEIFFSLYQLQCLS